MNRSGSNSFGYPHAITVIAFAVLWFLTQSGGSTPQQAPLYQRTSPWHGYHTTAVPAQWASQAPQRDPNYPYSPNPSLTWPQGGLVRQHGSATAADPVRQQEHDLEMKKNRDRVILAAAQLAIGGFAGGQVSSGGTDLKLEEIFPSENLPMIHDEFPTTQGKQHTLPEPHRVPSKLSSPSQENRTTTPREMEAYSNTDLPNEKTSRELKEFEFPLLEQTEADAGNSTDIWTKDDGEDWGTLDALPLPEVAGQQSLETFLMNVTSLPLTTASTTLNWSLDDAINAALLYSFRIAELRITTVENYQDIGIQFGRFDTTSFFQQTFRDSSTPVGNNFEVDGNAQRIKGEEFNFEYGIRQELRSGGQIELSRQFGTRDNDSGVLNPPNQASSELSLAFSKELLRGSGRSIAMNEVLIASQRAEAGKFESVAQVTELLGQVSDAYWEIVSSRARLIAAIESANQAKLIWEDLEARRNIDADPNLSEQARVSWKQQQAAADSSFADLSKSQFELVRLVNAPELLQNLERIEIIPVGIDFEAFYPPDIASRQNTAIHSRPEVSRVIEEIKEAQLQHQFSINELLPRLNFNAEMNFEGLSGNRDLAAAARNMFDANATYQLGFDFELPIQNRQARFSKRRAELTLAKLRQQWLTAVEQVKNDVLIAVQDLETNNVLIERQRSIFNSSLDRLVFLLQRRYRIPKQGAIPSLQLGQLLDVQAQLASSKADYVEALANRQRSMFELNRATGILVRPGDAGLSQPGRNKALVVFRQYIEGDHFYREHADQIAGHVDSVSKRRCSTWNKDCLGKRTDFSSAGFEYPLEEFADYLVGQCDSQACQSELPIGEMSGDVGQPVFGSQSTGWAEFYAAPVESVYRNTPNQAVQVGQLQRAQGPAYERGNGGQNLFDRQYNNAATRMPRKRMQQAQMPQRYPLQSQQHAAGMHLASSPDQKPAKSGAQSKKQPQNKVSGYPSRAVARQNMGGVTLATPSNVSPSQSRMPLRQPIGDGNRGQTSSWETRVVQASYLQPDSHQLFSNRSDGTSSGYSERTSRGRNSGRPSTGR